MEKKQIIFALKIFLASVLLAIFAGFLGDNPLGISQEQVVVALYSIFLGLGMLTVILTFNRCGRFRPISSILTFDSFRYLGGCLLSKNHQQDS